MGMYYNPPQELPTVGRKIEGSTYEECMEQLEEGEFLYGHYDRIIFQNAPYLHSEQEFNAFKNMGLIFLGYYALPSDVHPFDKY